MKNYFILFSFCVLGLIGCSTSETIVVNNPYTSGSNDAGLFVQKVEINDQYTIIDFVSMNYIMDTVSSGGATLYSDSYIQTLRGKKYKMIKADGISISQIDSEKFTCFTTPDNYIHFRVFFEPIPKKTKIFSFSEPGSNGWHIDYISLVDSISHGILRYKYNNYDVLGDNNSPHPIVLAISAFDRITYDENHICFGHKMADISVQVSISDCYDFYADYNSVVNNDYYTLSQSFSNAEYKVREIAVLDPTEAVVADIHAYYKDQKKYEITYMWRYGFALLDNLVEQYIEDNAVAIAFSNEDASRIVNLCIPLTKVYSVQPNCIHFQKMDCEVTHIDLRDNCTLVYKRLTATSKEKSLSAYSSTNEYIEDATSGRKYFLHNSTLSLNPNSPTIWEDSALDFVETYPAISGVHLLNINSGSSYFLKNIDLSEL